MTLDELYKKTLTNDELKESLAKAAEEGNIVAWAAEQGVEATDDDLRAYALHARLSSGDAEDLTDDELAEVAGGWNPVQSVMTTQASCY